MIIAFTTRAHCRTHTALKRQRRFGFKVIPYERLFRLRRLPRATYLFTDMDRLHFWSLELAARIHRQLAAAGARVLNDPARVRTRYALLEALHREGVNRFGVWRACDEPPQAAYPLFLRTDSAHRNVLTGLLHNAADLADARTRAVADGIPERELMAVQYCARPVREGLYRKLAVHRIGEAMVSAPCVHQNEWWAKYGEQNVATEALYREEREIVTSDPYGARLRRAFDIGAIEYGRADFGLVDDIPQVYEINTNPAVRPPKGRHPNADRRESHRRFMDNFTAALAEIDGPAAGRPIRLHDPRTLRRRAIELVRTGRWRVPMTP